MRKAKGDKDKDEVVVAVFASFIYCIVSEIVYKNESTRNDMAIHLSKIIQ